MRQRIVGELVKRPAEAGLFLELAERLCGADELDRVYVGPLLDQATKAFIVQRMKLVVEPSAATGLAVVRRLADELRGKRVGVVLSGGNTDFAWMR